MSVASRVIVEGKVIQTSSRSINPKSDPTKTIVFRNALIVGDACIADIAFPDGVELPKEGTSIRAQVEVGTFRDDDTLRLVQYLA